ncbi:MAG TPA: PilZ domain-containing protein [Pelomicrobium sp.]|nr:PilZ domain-containing protein [Pelomicrobium sp.]
MPDPNPIDRRASARFPFHGHATLRRGDTLWDVRLLDVSRSGALVVVPESWPGVVGDRFDLAIPVVAGAEYVRAEARVARSQGRLVGLFCVALDLSNLVALSRLVELNLGSPRLLERDLPSLLTEAS